MGYVTELELELAKENIAKGKLEVDEDDDTKLQRLRTMYGLYWLGYEKDEHRMSK